MSFFMISAFKDIKNQMFTSILILVHGHFKLTEEKSNNAYDVVKETRSKLLFYSEKKKYGEK